MNHLEAAFQQFHENNPKVYEALVSLARQAKDRGHKKIGIGLLWEVMRWQMLLNTTPNENDPYKLNNNHRSRYARFVMDNEADLKDFFKIRSLAGTVVS